MSSKGNLAAALAGAFLAGDWTRPGLIDSGATVLGARRRWLGPLARSVVDVYHRPPHDRPRELAAVIAESDPFLAAWDKARHKGVRLHPLRYAVPATSMTRARWPVPVIDDLAALAQVLDLAPEQVDWLADTRQYQRRTPLGPLQPYRYHWVARPGRVPRLIEAPASRLLKVQRRLLSEVLALIPVHPSAHGFVRSRNVATATAPHAGAGLLLSLDLRTFFASVTASRVYGLLRYTGYPEPVAHTMTGLMTLRTPVAIISGMPAGGRAEDRHLLRQSLRGGHLPQGAATSPALANAIAFRFDARCAGYAQAIGWRYTRYADDLLFSGEAVPRRAATAIRAISRIASEEGFVINPAKTRARPSSERQQALGVVLNQRPTLARDEYDRLRAILHNATRTGGNAQNRGDHPDFQAHLAGRISWVAALDPLRGARLSSVFDQIDWAVITET